MDQRLTPQSLRFGSLIPSVLFLSHIDDRPASPFGHDMLKTPKQSLVTHVMLVWDQVHNYSFLWLDMTSESGIVAIQRNTNYFVIDMWEPLNGWHSW